MSFGQISFIDTVGEQKEEEGEEEGRVSRCLVSGDAPKGRDCDVSTSATFIVDN